MYARTLQHKIPNAGCLITVKFVAIEQPSKHILYQRIFNLMPHSLFSILLCSLRQPASERSELCLKTLSQRRRDASVLSSSDIPPNYRRYCRFPRRTANILFTELLKANDNLLGLRLREFNVRRRRIRCSIISYIIWTERLKYGIYSMIFSF